MGNTETHGEERRKPALYSMERERERVKKEQAVGIMLGHIIGQKAEDNFGIVPLEDGGRSLFSLKFSEGSWLVSVTTQGMASTSLDISRSIRNSKAA